MEKKQALKLYIVLSRAYRAASEWDKRRIRAYGLSPSEFGVLELLLHQGPQPIQKLARKILLTSGSMTYVVSRLEEKGLIRRAPSGQDRRVFYAELTKAGRARMEEIFPEHEGFLHAMMDVFSDEDAAVLIAQLKHLGLSMEGRNEKEMANRENRT